MKRNIGISSGSSTSMKWSQTSSELKVVCFPLSNKNKSAKFFYNPPTMLSVPKILSNLCLACHLEDKFAHRS